MILKTFGIPLAYLETFFTGDFWFEITKIREGEREGENWDTLGCPLVQRSANRRRVSEQTCLGAERGDGAAIQKVCL